MWGSMVKKSNETDIFSAKTKNALMGHKKVKDLRYGLSEGFFLVKRKP